MGRVNHQAPRLVVADPRRQHFRKAQQNVPQASFIVAEKVVWGIGEIDHRSVCQRLRLSVVPVGENRRHGVNGICAVVRHVIAPKTEDGIHSLEDVRPGADRIGPFQVPAQAPVQVRPLVHKPPGGRVPVGAELFVRLFDLKHALRDVVFRSVRQDQPFGEAELRSEPDFIDRKIKVAVQVGERHTGLPPHAVVQVAGDFSALQERLVSPVFRVVVQSKGNRPVPVQKFQLCDLGEVPP